MRIEPAKHEWLERLVRSDDEFTAKFGISVEPGWAGFPEALPAALMAAENKAADPWGSYLFFADDGALVGFGGFKGPPQVGAVEIGYAIAPARRRRGLATEAVTELISLAAANGVARVVAHTLPGPNPSTGVLRKSGFVFAGEEPDPDGGVDEPVWLWLLEIEATRAS